ncbi:hypothetical protein EDB89DRAFT_2076160 [Lactarius sanguifluus]|nr:hypothetical protein EDB89DRAFT_2076160 [Lactarius sanguifluus]
MSWLEFKEQAYERFKTGRKDLHLGYRMSGGKHAWVSLTSKPEWKEAITSLEEKALAARTRPVMMELMDICALVHPTKARAKGKGKAKRSHEDDIPPEATPEAKHQYNHLLELQRHLLCSVHSTSGLQAYCWIEPAKEGALGGYCEELKNADKHLPLNVCKLDRPPATKKAKAAGGVPEVHIAVNITPTPGVGTPQSSYVMSETPIPSGTASTSGPSHVGQASGITLHTKTPTSTPVRRSQANRYLIMMLDCYFENRVPTAKELLTFMDAECPDPDLRYADAYSNLEEFGFHNTQDIVDLKVPFLSSFGLGHDGAHHVHQYAQERFLKPLSLMGTLGPSGGASIEEVVTPAVQDVGQCSSEGEGNEGECKTIKKEVIMDWLTEVAPGMFEEIEVEDEGTGVDEIEEDEIEEEEIEDEIEEINGSDMASVTSEQE